MFHRFSGSARSVLIRAINDATADGLRFIEPGHILCALIDLYPGVFERLSDQPIDGHVIQRELVPTSKPYSASAALKKPRFSEQTKRIFLIAYESARAYWEQFEAPRRAGGQILPEDLKYWETRLGRPIPLKKHLGWLDRRLFRGRWEVDERHLLVGILSCPECLAASVLAEHGATLEAAQKLLTTH